MITRFIRRRLPKPQTGQTETDWVSNKEVLQNTINVRNIMKYIKVVDIF